MPSLHSVGWDNRNAARRLSKVLDGWAARSLAASGVASLGDYSVLLVCAKLLRLPSTVSAFLGLCIGISSSFLLNRRFAFRQSSATFGGALVRYLVAIGCLIPLHAVTVGLLTDRVQIPIVLAKLLADATLLAGGQLLLLRYVVFPRNKDARSAVSASRAAELA